LLRCHDITEILLKVVLNTITPLQFVTIRRYKIQQTSNFNFATVESTDQRRVVKINLTSRVKIWLKLTLHLELRYG